MPTSKKLEKKNKNRCKKILLKQKISIKLEKKFLYLY